MNRLVLLLIIVFISAPACTSILGAPPHSPVGYQGKIEMLIDEKDYNGALSEAKRALSYYPREGFFHIRKGELLEVLGKSWASSRAYRRALKKLSPDNPWYREILYRYGLFLALIENDLQAAEDVLTEIDPDSPHAIDLRGVIALVGGDERKALQIFNETAGTGVEKEVASRISLHAAMAYHSLGDMENTNRFLYQSVNLAGKTLQLPRIEAFWEIVKESGNKE